MTRRCFICGQYISEDYLFANDESIECCPEHGMITICGACMDYFNASKAEGCIVKAVNEFKKSERFKQLPWHLCPDCSFKSRSFHKTANHMIARNHLYEGRGTYPIGPIPPSQLKYWRPSDKETQP